MNQLRCDTLFAAEADTMTVPEALARPDSDQHVEIPKAYRMGYFQDNPLLHPEVAGHRVGIAVEPLEGQLWRNDWLTSLVLVCLIGLILVLHRNGKQLLTEAKHFLFTPHGHNAPSDADLSIGRAATLFFIFLLSLMAAFCVVWFMQETSPERPEMRFPYLLLGLCTVGGLLCIWLRYTLYRFINWVFFDKAKSFTWKRDYLFLLSVEAIMLFPTILMSVYFSFPPKNVFWTVIFIVIFIKFLLLLRGRQTFFRNFYGLFHLIVYLCTLETIPLLVVVRILVRTTESLNVIF